MEESVARASFSARALPAWRSALRDTEQLARHSTRHRKRVVESNATRSPPGLLRRPPWLLAPAAPSRWRRWVERTRLAPPTARQPRVRPPRSTSPLWPLTRFDSVAGGGWWRRRGLLQGGLVWQRCVGLLTPPCRPVCRHAARAAACSSLPLPSPLTPPCSRPALLGGAARHREYCFGRVRASEPERHQELGRLPAQRLPRGGAAHRVRQERVSPPGGCGPGGGGWPRDGAPAAAAL